METAFTPVTSLIGGELIGLASVFLMAATGRIAGITGVVARALPPKIDRISVPTSLAFIVGLLAAAPLLLTVDYQIPDSFISASTPLLIVAGLLVGFGSVRGNGCTSGHGVCGISRLSIRSIIATITFMTTGAIAVFVMRHVFGA
ncbi:MAG: YeeE/YedE family protein [Rhizobiales bacterium]|nr:YeeE/YedE family protein [Hyphomicrobiales bacterium]